ncbi:hypothetical protein B7G68_05700 [Caulobacter segnis]|nr:hypothetical protein B7G68_05700 [Caulobacter segnis]
MRSGLGFEAVGNTLVMSQDSAKQDAKREAFKALNTAKPRSVIIDGLVFLGGVGSLLWVLRNMTP